MKAEANGSGSKTFYQRFKEVAQPYREQFRRAPWPVKVAATLCLLYLILPVDPWDVLVPWLAWQDDLFIAGVLLKLLHKYGAQHGEEFKSAKELLRQLLTKHKK